jgi:pyruvate/2-oxoglutarate/acetoin dehydrogenase E1 component
MATDTVAGVETMTYREALRLAMREELERDESVFLLGEEIGVFQGSYKVTAGLYDDFGPERVMETPISEEGFVGAAIGAAMSGMRPVAEIMTLNFIVVAMDQIVNHAAKVRYMFGGKVGCPLVIRTPNGAGNQLTAQHSQSFEGWFANVPGLKVVAPATPADARGLLKTANRDDDPVLVIENLQLYKAKGEVDTSIDGAGEIGRAAVAREERQPAVLEVMTYRLRGHSVADAGTAYRTKEEIAEWADKRDPIALCTEKLVAAGATAEELDAIVAEAQRVVDEAVAFAEASAMPDVSTLADFVYGDPQTGAQFSRMRPGSPAGEGAVIDQLVAAA